MCSVKVFKYIVKNSSQYDFTIVKMKALESKKHEAALLGSISQNRWLASFLFYVHNCVSYGLETEGGGERQLFVDV